MRCASRGHHRCHTACRHRARRANRRASRGSGTPNGLITVRMRSVGERNWTVSTATSSSVPPAVNGLRSVIGAARQEVNVARQPRASSGSMRTERSRMPHAPGTAPGARIGAPAAGSRGLLAVSGPAALRRQRHWSAHRVRDRYPTGCHQRRGPGHAAVQQSAAADDRPVSVTEAGPYAGRRPRGNFDRRRRPAVPVD